MCIAASCPIRDFYHKSTVSLWDNNGGWQRIIRGYSFPRLRQSQQDSEFSRKGSGAQLDFWLGNRNNTIGYRPEISDLNHLKGSVVNWRAGRCFPVPLRHGDDEIFRDQLRTATMGDPREMLLIIVMIWKMSTYSNLTVFWNK